MQLPRFRRGLIKARPSDEDGVYTILGTKMLLDQNDSLELSKHGSYNKDETNFVKKCIQPNSIVVDVGAHIGYYTLLMAKLAGYVHAFEPNKENFAILEKNVALNALGNVKLYNAAASDKKGSTLLYKCESNSGMHRLYPSNWCHGGHDVVETMRLDDVLDRADFIKMDIEGAEYCALKGMERILSERPTLFMEFDPPSITESGAEPRELYEYIKSFGYNIRLLNGENDYDRIEQITKNNDGYKMSLFCTAKE